ncbi:MAG: pyruvate dehydrogenase (acetyl-transferring) E1 component subunit alpha [Rickettsiales bacterium]
MNKKAAQKAELNKEQYLAYYHDMALIRRFEEKAGQAYGMGLIGGFCHLYIGQEAVVVGTKAALNNDDAMVTSYRDHGHILACGTEPKYVMAELFGKETGVSRGKGGSMHLFDIPKNFYGGHGIVGAQVPIGAGVAFAFKYRKEDRVAVTFFGDGAANQGQVYESFNMAKLWELPVIFVIENNKYGMGTSVERSTATGLFEHKAIAFGIEGKKVDGQDFFAVKDAMDNAVSLVRSGQGPQLLVMETYRYRGHSMSDPAKYRKKEEVDDYKINYDPIVNYKNWGIKNKLIEESDFKEIDKKVKFIIDDSIEFAKNSKEPLAAELWTDIYNNKQL